MRLRCPRPAVPPLAARRPQPRARRPRVRAALGDRALEVEALPADVRERALRAVEALGAQTEAARHAALSLTLPPSSQAAASPWATWLRAPACR